MIDIEEEKVFSLPQLSQEIKSSLGISLSYSSLKRFITDGRTIGTDDGEATHRMEKVNVGGSVYSSVEAFKRFVENTN